MKKLRRDCEKRSPVRDEAEEMSALNFLFIDKKTTKNLIVR